jgi:hypothetical protein
MRLRTLRLDQFRKFDRPMRLDGLRDGVNVLCAPNEFGKSTLLAALRAVLFEKHASKTDAIRGYQPRLGNTAPTLSLSFEQDGVLHSIEKRFLLRPSARLVSGGVAFEGDAAEERLATLLGVASASRGARDAARQAATIWGALLVDQGESFGQATLGDQARTTLSECLESELGAASGGAAIGRLLKTVQAQLGERLDGRGNPRDRYKAAMHERDSAEQEIASLQERRRLLQDDLAALVEARRALARDADPALDRQARASLDEARRHREALLGQRDRQGQATAAVGLAEAECAAIDAEIARRADRAAALEENARLLDTLTSREAEARSRECDAVSALEQGRAAWEASMQAVEAARLALAAAQARSDAQDRLARHAALRDRLADAETQATEIDALSARLSALRPDQAGILALRQAALADRGDRAALLAQATRVTVALSVPSTLSLDGAAPVAVPPGPALLELTGPATLRIDGIGEIAVAPASGDRERLLDAARDSARRLRTLLDAAGCADLDAAERANAERGQLTLSLEQARRALAAAAGKDGISALRAQEEALRPDRQEDVAADPAALREALDRARHDLDAAQRAETAARASLAAPERARDAARMLLAQAELERRTQEADRTRLAAERAQAEATESDDALLARRQAADEALSARRAALLALIEAAPEGTVALADARIARLEQADANRQASLSGLRETIVRLEGRIAREEGIGLDEQIEAQARRRDNAARAVADETREVAVLTLLRDTLLAADRSARARTLAPLVGRIGPYLQALFPGASVALDQDFQITGLSRNGVEGEGFGLLSHGTREQIAILARLAFADMLLASGRPAFLVLDDALAFADAARLERMFDIIADAGSRMQILVLTCREELAAALGGHRVRLEPEAA